MTTRTAASAALEAAIEELLGESLEEVKRRTKVIGTFPARRAA